MLEYFTISVEVTAISTKEDSMVCSHRFALCTHLQLPKKLKLPLCSATESSHQVLTEKPIHTGRCWYLQPYFC